MTVAIQFINVTKKYADGTVAVDALNLDIPTGKTTMLVGPSGCGKTTTLRMINRMVEPSSGRILLHGKDTAQMSKTKLRRSIGYVIQDAGLFPHRTVLQNIMTVPRLNGVGKKEAEQRAKQMMELVDLPLSFASRYPAQLSGGQQQRVGVARALAGDPDLILMDEPFSALDPVVRAELQSEFRDLVRKTGATIVFVTHDIDEAIKLGDKIALFEQGGIVAQFASPAELLRHPASSHVADFVGRDRGFRALSFAPFDLEAAGAVMKQCSPVTFGVGTLGAGTFEAGTFGSKTSGAGGAAGVGADGLTDERWRVVVDQQGRLMGWTEDSDAAASGDGSMVRVGVGVIAPGVSLRTALDAVLSSPNGEAAVVDDDGVPIGLVSLSHLVSAGLLEQDGTGSGGLEQSGLS